MLRGRLDAAGWTVEEAPDGLEGLEQLRRFSAEGRGFSLIIIDAYLPDIDGRLMLRGLRAMFSAVPIVLLVEGDDEADRELAAQLPPTICAAKTEIENGLLGELAKFGYPTTTLTTTPLPERWPLVIYDANMYLRLVNRAEAVAVFNRLKSVRNLLYLNAVRGDYDLIIRLKADNNEDLNRAIAEVQQEPGIDVVAMDRHERPMLSPQVEEFILHYEEVADPDREPYMQPTETNAYLLIDIDRYQMERVFTSILLTEGVISCHVAMGGAKLIVLMSGAVHPEVMGHVLRKLAVMGGIRRVREATVINITE